MSFSFLHTSDWHIGKPFGQFEAGLSAILRQSRLTAVDRLAGVARTGHGRHVVVAGDTYDRPSLSDRDLAAPLAQMGAHRDLTWHLIPGNHDPATAGGIWERILRIGLPPNVVAHLEARPVEIAAGAWLLPAPLSAKSMLHDPSAWMDEAPTPIGALRIGLAHGSIQSFSTEQRASIEIAPDRPRRAGLAYLALGDWHGVREIGPRAAYSGTPEPDGFLDNAPGQALLVTLDGTDAPPAIVRRPVGEHRWLSRTISTVRFSDLAEVEGEIEGLGAGARSVLLALELSGRASIEEERALRRRLDRLEPRLLFLERRLERLILAPATDDIERLPEGGLRDVVRELTALAATEGHDQQAMAVRALRHFFELSDAVLADDRQEAA